MNKIMRIRYAAIVWVSVSLVALAGGERLCSAEAAGNMAAEQNKPGARAHCASLSSAPSSSARGILLSNILLPLRAEVSEQ